LWPVLKFTAVEPDSPTVLKREIEILESQLNKLQPADIRHMIIRQKIKGIKERIFAEEATGRKVTYIPHLGFSIISRT